METGLWKFGDGTGKYSGKPNQPTETSIVNATVKAVRKEYPNSVVVKIHGGGFQSAGIPDLYIAVDGEGLWVEMKRPGSDTTALQKRFLEKLWANSIPCGTADNPEMVLAILRQLLIRKSRA